MSDPKSPDFVIQDAVRGRGRPKKDTPPKTEQPAPRVKTQATTAEVKQAMRTLESSYSAIALGLTALGLPDSATVWVEQAETLSKSNEQTLTASPKLAKRIASLGQGGGAGAFILAHALAIAPVIPVVRAEMERSPVVGYLGKRRASARQAAEDGTPGPSPAPGAFVPSAGVQEPSEVRADPTLIPGYGRRSSAA